MQYVKARRGKVCPVRPGRKAKAHEVKAKRRSKVHVAREEGRRREGGQDTYGENNEEGKMLAVTARIN